MAESKEPRRIVVGVSGKGGSGALRWATAEARLRGAEVWAVHVWAPGAAAPAPYAPPARPDRLDADRQAAGDRLRAAVRSVVGPAGDLQVRTVLEQGAAEKVLVSLAAGADLLVVGSHPWPDPVSRTFGPTVRACLAASPCPTVVVGSAESRQPPETNPFRELAASTNPR